MEKFETLELVSRQLENRYGRGAVMRLGKIPSVFEAGVISTGALSLDIAIGIGGVPRGRIVEIFGAESAGKTSLALHIIAQAQRSGGLAAFIDVEHALDPGYAARIGVDVDNLFVSQPDDGEEALDIADSLIRSGSLDVLVVDSVAALVPRAEMDTAAQPAGGLQAALMSRSLRKLASGLSRTGTCAVFVNQLRYGPDAEGQLTETTPGGSALKYYSSLRLDVRRDDFLYRNEEVYGERIRVKTVKNRTAPPFKQAVFDIVFGEGIFRTGSIVEAALQWNVLRREEDRLIYRNCRFGGGGDDWRDFFSRYPQLLEELERETRIAAGIGMSSGVSGKRDGREKRSNDGRL